MGFSGGGSNILKPHTHDPDVLQDGGTLISGTTEISGGALGDTLHAGAVAGSIYWSKSNIYTKQHYVYYFTGSVFGTSGGQSADGVWTMRENVTGVPTFTYANDDKGLLITPNTGASAWPQLDFNGVIPFIETGSVIEGSVSCTVGSSSGGTRFGFGGTINTTENQSAVIQNLSTNTNFMAMTKSGAAGSSDDTGVPIIQNGTFYTVKIICKAASIEFYINDTLVVTKTTNLPTISMSPKYYCINGTAGQQLLMNIRFCEAYNV